MNAAASNGFIPVTVFGAPQKIPDMQSKLPHHDN